MSQYPSPFTPPPYPPNFDYYQPAGGQWVVPGRRAGVLMMILGGLAVLAGFCIGAAALVVPMDQIVASQKSALPPEAMNGVTPELMRFAMVFAAGLTFAVGIALLVLGFFVRKGGRGPAIASLVLTGLMALVLGIEALSRVALTVLHPNPMLAMSACMVVIPLMLLILLLVWLVQAVRASNQLKIARQQNQMQMWQATQQQTTAGQSGYGYGQPTSFPPPPGYPPAPPQNQQVWAPPPPPQQQAYAPPTAQSDAPPARHPPLPPDMTGQGPPAQ